MRHTEDVHVETDTSSPGRNRATETHPAFGVATVTRSSGSSRALFQSDLLHQHTMTLRIDAAERHRELNRDWVHPRGHGRTIVEVEMSLAQWGSLVSSIGLGSGVPVTIRATETDQMVPDIPHQPRIQTNLDEVAGTVDRLLAGVRTQMDALEEAVEQKKGVRAIREALKRLRATVANLPSNSKFAVTSLTEAAEKVTAQARADIEAHILAAVHAAGASSVALDGVLTPQAAIAELSTRPDTTTPEEGPGR